MLARTSLPSMACGGTGAAPKVIRDNVGIPIELAISSLDRRLRQDGIRNRCSIIAAGGIRCSADVIKAIALGADATYIGSAALIAMGCNLCQKCYTGKCNWGICTQDPRLAGRLNVDIASQRLVNLISAWSHEIQEMLGEWGSMPWRACAETVTICGAWAYMNGSWMSWE